MMLIFRAAAASTKRRPGEIGQIAVHATRAKRRGGSSCRVGHDRTVRMHRARWLLLPRLFGSRRACLRHGYQRERNCQNNISSKSAKSEFEVQYFSFKTDRD